MINRPTESELLKLARIKINKNTPLEERVIHMHFFLDGHDWYVSEYDPQRRTFFGYRVPNDEYHRAGWDHFSIDELYQMRGHENRRVTRNADWTPRPALKIDRIRDAYTWQNDRKRPKQKRPRNKNRFPGQAFM